MRWSQPAQTCAAVSGPPVMPVWTKVLLDTVEPAVMPMLNRPLESTENVALSAATSAAEPATLIVPPWMICGAMATI